MRRQPPSSRRSKGASAYSHISALRNPNVSRRKRIRLPMSRIALDDERCGASKRLASTSVALIWTPCGTRVVRVYACRPMRSWRFAFHSECPDDRLEATLFYRNGVVADKMRRTPDPGS